jgi:hypothetical protein
MACFLIELRHIAWSDKHGEGIKKGAEEKERYKVYGIG